MTPTTLSKVKWKLIISTLTIRTLLISLLMLLVLLWLTLGTWVKVEKINLLIRGITSVYGLLGSQRYQISHCITICLILILCECAIIVATHLVKVKVKWELVTITCLSRLILTTRWLLKCEWLDWLSLWFWHSCTLVDWNMHLLSLWLGFFLLS